MRTLYIALISTLLCLLYTSSAFAAPTVWKAKVPVRVEAGAKFVYTVRATVHKKSVRIKCSYPSQKVFTKPGTYKLVCRAKSLSRAWKFAVYQKPSHSPITATSPVISPVDRTAPQLFLPQAKVLSFTQTAPLPTAIDETDGPVTPVCSTPAFIPVGEHTISCTAEDSSGNSSTGKYQMTRLDEAPETIDLDLAQTLGQPTSFPAPNETASFKLNNPASAAAVTIDDNEYSYQTAQYTVEGEVFMGRIKEDIHVKQRLGTKTWSWTLAAGSGSAPKLQADGSVTFGTGLKILPAVITDIDHKPLAVMQPTWNVQGNTLSLAVNDAGYPVPYLIDPTTVYPSVSITAGPANLSSIAPGVQTIDFTYTDGPATKIECRMVRANWGVANYVYPNGPCTALSSSFTTPYLSDGMYTIDILVYNTHGASYARRTFWIDSSPPEPFTYVATGHQELSIPRNQTLPACAYTPAQDGLNGFSLQFASRPFDRLAGVLTSVTSISGQVDGTSAPVPIAYDAIGWRVNGPFTSGLHYAATTTTNKAGLSTTIRYDFTADNTPPTAVTDPVPSISASSTAGKKRAMWNLDSTDDSCMHHYLVIVNKNLGPTSQTPASPLPDMQAGGTGTSYWTVGGGYGNFMLDKLEPRTTYQYRVIAVDSFARSAPTPWLTFTTPA